MEKEQFERLFKVIEKYGFNNQSDLLIEEMSELTKAITKYKRLTGDGQPLSKPLSNKDALENITEEIADVHIMLEEIIHLLNIDRNEIDSWIKRKIDRTIHMSTDTDSELNKTPLIIICPNIPEVLNLIHGRFAYHISGANADFDGDVLNIVTIPGSVIEELFKFNPDNVEDYMRNLNKETLYQGKVIIFPIDMLNSYQVEAAKKLMKFNPERTIFAYSFLGIEYANCSHHIQKMLDDMGYIINNHSITRLLVPFTYSAAHLYLYKDKNLNLDEFIKKIGD